MAHKKKHFKRGGFTLPVAAVAGFIPLGIGTVQHGMWNGWTGQGDTGLDYLTRSLTGYSPNSQGFGGKFNLRNMEAGLVPIVVGLAAHKFVGGTLGVNRLLARARIPIIRI